MSGPDIACAAHSGGNAEFRQDHELKQKPDDEKSDKPKYFIHFLFLRRKSGGDPAGRAALNIGNVRKTVFLQNFRAFLRTPSGFTNYIDGFFLVEFGC